MEEKLQEEMKKLSEELMELSTNKKRTLELTQELLGVQSGIVSVEITKGLDKDPNFMDQFKSPSA